MMKKYAVILLSLLMVLTSMAALADSEAVSPAFLTVTGGDIMGYLDDGIYTFAGIPYGTAERFASPEPASWEGIKNCMAAGPVCPQSLTRSATADVNYYSFFDPAANDLCGNEEKMLNLNVWTDSLDPNAKKPVMIFLHGGGSTTGSSWELRYYEGSYMADYTDVVFVSPNMRLNVLGFMNLSAYGDETWAESGNQSLEDTLLALQWVHDNIEKFGGDPDNITIMGQSGGGGKLSALCCSPKADGLFKRAYFMSTGYSTKEYDNAAESAKLVEYLGLTAEDDIIGTLQKMPYEELLNAADACGFRATYNIGGNELYPSPLINAETGEVNPHAAKLTYMNTYAYAEFVSNNNFYATAAPVDTRHMKPFQTPELVEELLKEKYCDKTEKVKELYAQAYPTHDIADVMYMNMRSTTVTDMLVDAGLTVYNGMCAYEYPYLGGSLVQHTGDMPLWFHSIDSTFYQIQGDEECGHKVQDEMCAAFGNFCATGDPSTETLEWKPCTPEAGYTMVFDRESELKDLYFDAELIKTIKGE